MIAFSVTGNNGITLYPAIAPALITVGCLMIKNVKKVDWDDHTESIPSFLCIAIMAFSMSITEGIAFGFISYTLLKVVKGEYRKISLTIYIITGLLLIRYIFLK